MFCNVQRFLFTGQELAFSFQNIVRGNTQRPALQGGILVYDLIAYVHVFVLSIGIF